MLGGSYAQLPIIREAKAKGLYVIICDYLPDNPGRHLADEYHNISTTDKQAVLSLAKAVQANFVIAYASDPAAPVAAYVAEQLGLPGNSFQCVQTLAEKDRFRNFLKKHHFNTPQSISLHEDEIQLDRIDELHFPLIVKPTDSSGSKGVVKINHADEFESACQKALVYSRNKRLVIEEFIDTQNEQLHGDGYVLDGKLIFSYLGDHRFNVDVNPFVPYSTTWPSRVPQQTLHEVEKEVQRLISLVGFQNGPINIEARIYRDKIYIMEIGPRNGGNFVPQALKWICNFDMVNALINNLLGKEISYDHIDYGCGAYYVIHSADDGKLKDIMIHDGLKKYIKESHQYIAIGEEVTSFQGSNAAIGILLLQFENTEQMNNLMPRINQYVQVELE